MKPITRNDINIRVIAEDEDISIKQAAKDCAPGFEDAVRAMKRKSRRWGWCCVHIVVSLKSNPDITGDAYLGGCSYASRKDFIENSCYYDQMVDDAIADMKKAYQRHVEDLIDGIEGLADGQDDGLGQLLTQCATELRAGIKEPVAA
jgi:hypothetical protein